MGNSEISNHPPVSEVEIRQQLDRILDFPELQASDRRRKMLKYVVEETLADRATELKGPTIAMAVFDRGSDFNQQVDAVVRLEARKLRRDLDNYYAGAGRDDPVRIDIPKGGYIPQYTRREPVRTDENIRAEEPASDIEQFSKSRARFSSRHAAAVLIENFEAQTDNKLVSAVASGLTNGIAAALIRFPDLAVHLTPDQAQIGLESTASAGQMPTTEFLLTGNVWREGGDLLVRANLIRRADLKVLWSERYVEGTKGQSITHIQDTISSEIATAIGQQYGYALRDVRSHRLGDRHDPDLRGFACVASAQIYRRTYNRDEYQSVRDCLEATVLEDPDYVRAWAMLAYLRNDAARFGHEKYLSRGEAFDLARQAATRAIDLDPHDTDALQAMSHVEQYAGDMERSIEFARRAVDENPNDPAALANLAIRYAVVGRFSEAVPAMQNAIDRSVAPPPFYFHVLSADHLIKEEWPAMLSAAERASADGWSFSQAMLAIANARLSNRWAAQKALNRMAELDPALADDPRTWLEGHNYNQVLVEAIVAGLSEARAAVTE